MSEAVAAASAPTRPERWPLWRRQVLAILRVELRRNLFGRHALVLYMVAALPVFVVLMLRVGSLVLDEDIFQTLGDARSAFASLYQTLILRGLLFFGCAAVFLNLFRGEMLQRSLHFYLLSAVRREVLVVGKFLAGVVLTGLVFVVSLTLSFLLVLSAVGAGSAVEDLLSGAAGAHLISYIGVTLLACVGYGAIFLGLGLLLRNPVIPVVIVFGWEGLHFLLPPLLKKFSVIHYLKGLVPLPMSGGPFAVVSEPPSAAVSVIGLLLFAMLVIALSAWRVRRLEIDYGDD